MTANHCIKQASWRYARRHRVKYRDALAAVRRRGTDADWLDDEIVQTALFGGVIYRFEARPRTNTFHA